MTNIELAKQDIRDEALRAGDEIVHLWDTDLCDGTFNVKAIIVPKDGKPITVGCRVFG